MLPSLTGIVTSIERKTGKNGDYAKTNVNGQYISFFPPAAEQAFKIAEGTQVQVEYTEKGQYKNGTSIKPVGISAGVGDQTPAAPVKESNLPTGGNESMMVSYAKDLMIANKDLTPELAVATIFELIREVKDFSRATVGQTT